MAKTKTSKSGASPKKQSAESPEQLYDLAIQSVETSDPEAALEYGKRLLALVQALNTPNAVLPALNLLGEISVELGDAESARNYFQQAVNADPEGAVPEALGGGAEKFLWMAQLCEEGGAASVAWFERGVVALKKEIGDLESKASDDEVETLLEEKRAKLANALCGVVEVYMTDLSWEQDAESRCEALITEALMASPESPEVLQTLASVRLSQLKLEDARSALTRSVNLWKNLDPEDPLIPDFPNRVSLARLLMEAEMEEEAFDVLDRLALEDDQSVEACYLGGWCLNLIADKKKALFGESAAPESPEAKEILATYKASRSWLLNTLKLYRLLEYEDERLEQHTQELVAAQSQLLGPPPEDGNDEDEDDDDDWDGFEDDQEVDGDQEMAGM